MMKIALMFCLWEDIPMLRGFDNAIKALKILHDRGYKILSGMLLGMAEMKR